MSFPPFLKSSRDGTVLSVKLQPRASRQGIVGVQGAELRISVTAPPVDAAANRALVELLAEILEMPRSAVHLVRGQTSRHKTVLLAGVTMENAADRLARHL
jgi:uncharacterized protein (TIGR00251 family)